MAQQQATGRYPFFTYGDYYAWPSGLRSANLPYPLQRVLVAMFQTGDVAGGLGTLQHMIEVAQQEAASSIQ